MNYNSFVHNLCEHLFTFCYGIIRCPQVSRRLLYDRSSLSNLQLAWKASKTTKMYQHIQFHPTYCISLWTSISLFSRMGRILRTRDIRDKKMIWDTEADARSERSRAVWITEALTEEQNCGYPPHSVCSSVHPGHARSPGSHRRPEGHAARRCWCCRQVWLSLRWNTERSWTQDNRWAFWWLIVPL